MDAGAAVWLYFVLMMQTRLFTVQIEPVVFLEVSPVYK